MNERLVGRGAGSTATGPGTEWAEDSGTDSLVASSDGLLLITDRLHSCPTRQTPKPGVSHTRLAGRVLIAHGILSDVRTLWWFGPLLALVALGIGRKGMFRLAKYVASVFMHTHTLS